MKGIIYKGKSNSIGVILFLFCITIYLMVLSFITNYYVLGIIFLFFIIMLIKQLYKTYNTFFLKEFLETKRIFNKKRLNINYEDIKYVNMLCYSDTIFRSKNLIIVLKDGTRVKIVVVHVLIEVLAKIFNDKDIPVYILENEKYKLYKKPIYK